MNGGPVCMRAQNGVTFTGFLINCVLIGLLALLGMRLFPLYSESFKVKTAMKSIAESPDISTMSAEDIRAAMMRRFDIDDVTRFDDKDLKSALHIMPNTRGKGRVLSMTYETRVPLIANFDIVFKFDETRPIAGTASE